MLFKLKAVHGDYQALYAWLLKFFGSPCVMIKSSFGGNAPAVEFHVRQRMGNPESVPGRSKSMYPSYLPCPAHFSKPGRSGIYK
jgi:hypothetical protein